MAIADEPAEPDVEAGDEDEPPPPEPEPPPGRPPLVACYTCKGRSFYMHGTALPVCGTCHPPADPESVEWIDVGEEVAVDAP